jgi:hypothetical protein
MLTGVSTRAEVEALTGSAAPDAVAEDAAGLDAALATLRAERRVRS